MQYIVHVTASVDWLGFRSIVFKNYKAATECYDYNVIECRSCIEHNKVVYAHIQMYSRSHYLGKWKRTIDTLITKNGLVDGSVYTGV